MREEIKTIIMKPGDLVFGPQKDNYECSKGHSWYGHQNEMTFEFPELGIKESFCVMCIVEQLRMSCGKVKPVGPDIVKEAKT